MMNGRESCCFSFIIHHCRVPRFRFAFRNHFVERVLEEESFEAVARVARGASARERTRVLFVVPLFEDAKREAVEKSARAFEREVYGVIRERAYLVAKAHRVPRRMQST